MAIYGAALLSHCPLVGLMAGSAIGKPTGVDKNIAMPTLFQ